MKRMRRPRRAHAIHVPAAMGGFALLLLLAAPAMAAPWTRSFAVTLYEPAFHYGGPAGTIAAPGSDCPQGTVPDNDYRRLLQTGWRSAAEIARLTAPQPPGVEPYRLLAPALHFRASAPGIDSYINPFAAPDPGLPAVSGRIAEGFDLDGRTDTGGFASPDGQRGIDNGLYRALGCLMAFRGPPGQGALSARANARMQSGLFTMLIRLSGQDSPDNDAHVLVEIGASPDALVRNADGVVLRDYSYRLVRSAQYTRLSGRIRDGVLTAGPVARLTAPDFAWSESNRGEAVFLRGRLSLTIAPDGSATGLIGGYRDWRTLYARTAFNVAVEGPFLEIPYHMNLIALYYALARNADADPDAQGRNRAISTAYRLVAVPAFAVDPPQPALLPGTAPSSRVLRERELFRQAEASHKIMPSP
jgi:hypothetical protein